MSNGEEGRRVGQGEPGIVIKSDKTQPTWALGTQAAH